MPQNFSNYIQPRLALPVLRCLLFFWGWRTPPPVASPTVPGVPGLEGVWPAWAAARWRTPPTRWVRTKAFQEPLRGESLLFLFPLEAIGSRLEVFGIRLEAIAHR